MTVLREMELGQGTVFVDGSVESERQPLEAGFWLHPFNMALGNEPTCPLQKAVSNEIVSRLTDGKNRIVALPTKETPASEVPQMIMIHGSDGWDGYNEDSFQEYQDAPDNAKPRFFMLNFKDKLPEVISMDTTRQQIARSACHDGVVFIGDPEGGIESITNAISISMQRNYTVFNGTPEQIFDQVLERIPYHFGTKYMDKREYYQGQDYEKDQLDSGYRDEDMKRPAWWLKWNQWSQAPFHREMKDLAVDLLNGGVITNEIDLYKYCQNNRRHARKIYLLINQTLGESMMGVGLGEKDFRVYAVSSSGANKASWDPSPEKGYLVPISHITRDGCVVMKPEGAPDSLEYGKSSVESREGALVHIAKQMIQLRAFSDFEGLYYWHKDIFSKTDIFPVFLPGLGFPGLVIEHNHNHARWYNSSQIELVNANEELFTKGDQPCGSEGGQWALLEGLFQLPCFKTRGSLEHPLNGKVGVVQFPGHGQVVVAENMEAMRYALLHGMEFMEPPCV